LLHPLALTYGVSPYLAIHVACRSFPSLMCPIQEVGGMRTVTLGMRGQENELRTNLSTLSPEANGEGDSMTSWYLRHRRGRVVCPSCGARISSPPGAICSEVRHQINYIKYRIDKSARRKYTEEDRAHASEVIWIRRKERSIEYQLSCRQKVWDSMPKVEIAI
jgi:hypothetical protein